MIGLIVVIVATIYIALLVRATLAAYRWAKKRGLSKGRRWAVAASAFLAIYLPVFWDHIPTLLAHKYYCEKEAGFWIYKTVEQWKKENPGVAGTLTWANVGARSSDPITKLQTVRLNERFIERLAQQRIPFLPVTKSEYAVVDEKTSEVVIRQIAIGAGYGNMMIGSDWRSLKFWLQIDPCFGQDVQGMHAFNSVREGFKRMGVQRW
jgi:hypothetical protein